MPDEEIKTTAIAKSEEPYAIEQCAMDPESLIAQAKAVQTVMVSVMKDDVHFGIIPGCKKPSLYKPGAEKLCMIFRLRPEFIIERENLPNGHREYEITCNLYSISTGVWVGQGVGCCSTMAGKYRYRNAGRVCPACGSEDTIIKGKEQYGGGWICFARKGGCGAKWSDNDAAITDQHPGKVEHKDPADYYNTVKKMAKKSAMIDAVLTATAASDIFTQDVEDMKDLLGLKDEKPAEESGNEKLKQKMKSAKTTPTNKEMIAKMANAFHTEFGISNQELEEYLGHPIDSIIAEDVSALRSLYGKMFAGEITWSEFIESSQSPRKENDAASGGNAELDGIPPIDLSGRDNCSPADSETKANGFDKDTGEQVL